MLGIELNSYSTIIDKIFDFIEDLVDINPRVKGQNESCKNCFTFFFFFFIIYILNFEKVVKMIEFRYDTQLLIEGKGLDEDKIRDYFTKNFKGDCLIAVGDSELIKIHFHTNEPWDVLKYCSTLGEIFDIVVEDMDRQSRGQKG